MAAELIALAEPIDGPLPAGVDVRQDAAARPIYLRLKDARAQARTAERTAEAASDPVVVPPAWAGVRALAGELLSVHAKDLEVAAWLIEALVRLEGFAGLARGFALVEALVARFWPDLRSSDEDDAQGRVSPLAGLNGIGGEGALIQPIRMVALLPGSPYGSNALWHLLRLQREPAGAIARDFNDTRTASDPVAIRELAAHAGEAKRAWAALTATLEDRCGPDAPPSSTVRTALDEVVDGYRTVLGIDAEAHSDADGSASREAPAAAPVEVPAPPPAAPAQPGGPRIYGNREDAFVELLRIADFFRRQEPHSPLSYTIEGLVARGRMSFAALLEELLPDGTSRRQFLQVAGIPTDGEGRIR